MTINIKDLLDTINARVASGTANSTEQVRLNSLDKFSKAYSHAVQYRHINDFDSATVSNEGIIAFSRDSDAFYVSHRNKWKPIVLGALLDESRRFQGEDYGFVSGGLNPGFSSSIERFPFSSFTNALTLGDLTAGKIELAGQSSELRGYSTGGKVSTGAVISEIEKFEFVNTTNSLLVGDLDFERSKSAGLSTNTHAIGFAAGGDATSQPQLTQAMRRIYKFPFANETQSSLHGNLYVSGSLIGKSEAIGISDFDFGYVAGGINETTSINLTSVDRFSFVAFTSSVYITNLTVANSKAAGNSSETHGYVSGGFDAFSLKNIERFSFNSPYSSIDVGDLSTAKRLVSGQSSRTDGYISGVFSPSISTIESFPFSASPVTITDAGDLVGSRHNTVGHQV
jgi:hypothetical protein